MFVLPDLSWISGYSICAMPYSAPFQDAGDFIHKNGDLVRNVSALCKFVINDRAARPYTYSIEY